LSEEKFQSSNFPLPTQQQEQEEEEAEHFPFPLLVESIKAIKIYLSKLKWQSLEAFDWLTG